MAAPALATFQPGLGAVTADNLNTFVQGTFEVTDLDSFTGTQGSHVYVDGFTTPGDGGAGVFYWNSTITGATTDNINTVVPLGGIQGAWIRLGYLVPPVSETYQVPVTGFSIIGTPGTNFLVLKPAGTLATGTVTLPVPQRDGWLFTITTTQTITALTVSAPAGQTILNAPSTLSAGCSVTFVYVNSQLTWFNVTPGLSSAGSTTGSGAVVLATSPTITTPTLNQAVLAGITSGANPGAGAIGQYVTSGPLSAVPMTSATPTTIGSITLTAGIWELYATYATVPAGTTTQTLNAAVISLTTNVLTAISPDVNMAIEMSVAAGDLISLPVGTTRVNITATTTFYLVGQTTFATSTLTAGGIISARRVS